MATVPYSGVPTVTPTPNSGIPYQSIPAANAEAFGSPIGQAQVSEGAAIQGFGNKVEQLGDMLAKHANTLQDRVNEADGNDLLVKWDIDKTKLLTDFQQLEGKQQHDAMPKFLQDQEALRQKYLGSASNVEVKRIFDNNSKRQFGYMVGEAGRSAAGQLRSYENNTAAALVQNVIDNAGAKTPQEVNDNIELMRKTIHSNVTNTRGLSEVEAENKTLAASSAYIERNVKSIQTTAPVAAREFYEKHKDDVNEQTKLRIEAGLQAADTNVGTKLIASSIVNGRVEGIDPLTPKADNDWLSKALTKAKQIADQPEYEKNPGMAKQLQANIINEYNMVKKGQTELERGNLNTLREVINGSSQTGKITSEDVIHQNPALEQVWQQVERDNPSAIPSLRSLIKKNTQDDVPLTQARVDKFNTLMGLRQSDPAAFLMIVPNEKDLTFAQQGKIFDAQRADTKKAESNTNFNNALSNKLVTGQLGESKIYPSKTDDAKEAQYNHFVGAFKTELEIEAARNNGKYPNADEQGKIAARILRNNPQPGMFGIYGGPFGSDVPAFEVPAADRTRIIDKFQKKYDRPPQEHELYKVYKNGG